jgi:cytochrome P450
MDQKDRFDWDPRSPRVLADQCAAYDEMRGRCPVARSEMLGWTLFRHEDVSNVLADPDTFSNQASQHRSVPNGMDPPEHGPYRAAIEPFFGPEVLREYAPTCRNIASGLLAALAADGSCDCIERFAMPFAARCQCAFLGWPERMAESMCDWTRRNRQATLDGDRALLTAIAQEFRAFVTQLLAERRSRSEHRKQDITARLLSARVNGEPLTDEDLTSLFRNWTVGEVGSLTAAVGIVVHELASQRGLQERLRQEPALLPVAIEEILRVRGPLVANVRRTTREVQIGGRNIPSGERVTLAWISANRDERVFEDPREVRLDRPQRDSLLFGAGIHVCPGAPLARLEMRIAIEELLRHSSHIELAREGRPTPAVYPANGWAT